MKKHFSVLESLRNSDSDTWREHDDIGNVLIKLAESCWHGNTEAFMVLVAGTLLTSAVVTVCTGLSLKLLLAWMLASSWTEQKSSVRGVLVTLGGLQQLKHQSATVNCAIQNAQAEGCNSSHCH
jgi:hypothetical protein